MKSSASNWQLGEPRAGYLPLLQERPISEEVGGVVDVLIASERDVESAAAIEPAQSIESRAVEIVEELGSLPAFGVTPRYEFVEPLAAAIVQRAVVAHLELDHQAPPQPAIEIDDVRIDVVEQGAPRQ